MKILPSLLSGLLALGLCFFGATSTVRAQDSQDSPPPAQVDTQWPGVTFRVMEIQHILQNRLLVIVAIEGGPATPAVGCFLGVKKQIPAALAKEPWLWSAYNSVSFSLMGATMTDELTGTKYPSLDPVAPPNTAYYPSDTLETIRPGGREILSLQFATPPPPPAPPPGQPPVIQKLSFLFPKAAGPITHVPLPPPGPPAPSGG